LEGKVEEALTLDKAKDIEKIWEDRNVKDMFSKHCEYQLPDCADYFLDKVTKLAKKNYMPSDDDILRARLKTTGVHETLLEKDGSTINIIDVGGQRSERRKWMMCFPDVTAIIFCISLSGYNLTLEEDNQTNRLQEDLDLFGEIVNSKWFVRTPLILFLNKVDLFEQMMEDQIPLTIAFPEYKGALEKDECIDYIGQQCRDKIRGEKEIYQYVTCATNTENIEMVWTAVYDIILNENLKKAGLQM